MVAGEVRPPPGGAGRRWNGYSRNTAERHRAGVLAVQNLNSVRSSDRITTGQHPHAGSYAIPIPCAAWHPNAETPASGPAFDLRLQAGAARFCRIPAAPLEGAVGGCLG